VIEYTTSTRGLLPALKTQVLVVGAGAAGLLAALAAGRNGADVTLVEYQGFVGGISATLTWLGLHDQEYRLVVKGTPLELVRRLQAAGEAGQFALDPKCSSALSLNTHYYKCLAVRLLEEAGVKLLLAGKCLSATHEAVASTRVIPICMAQGQAVGTAAALAVRRGVTPRDVPLRELQATLIAQGAELRQTLGEPNWAAIEEVGQLPRHGHSPAPAGMVNGEAPTVPAEQWIR
jgi:FAD dependent oxidoreductase/FAD binding domain